MKYSILKSRGFKRAVIAAAVIAAIALLMCFLLIPRVIDYEDLNVDIRTVKLGGNNGGSDSYSFFYGAAGERVGEDSKDVVVDYENGVRYYYKYEQVKGSRFEGLFAGENRNADLRLSADGKELGFNQSDRTETYTREEYIENPALMDSKCLRVYYVNGDNECVVMWEHPQAAEIEARCEEEINGDPLFYIRSTNKLGV